MEACPSPSALTSMPHPQWQLLMLPVKAKLVEFLFPLPSRTFQILSSFLFLSTQYLPLSVALQVDSFIKKSPRKPLP